MRAIEFVVEYKTEEYQGLRFSTDIKNGQLIVRALDDWGTNELGHVVFNIGDNDELDPQDLEVDDRYQGQGVAQIMYDYVKTLGYEIHRSYDQTPAGAGFWNKHRGTDVRVWENFDDGRVKGKSRPGRVKRAGASCNGSVTDLRRKAKNASGERAKMYHWCANMKSGKKKNK
jgi:GNAT superfamily N-acetyltransferase